jgi:hypothetical protein
MQLLSPTKGLLGFLFFYAWCTDASPQVFAQTPAPGADDYRKAIARLDVPVPAEWAKSRAVLMQLTKSPDHRDPATLALAYFFMRESNTAAISNLCKRIKVVFPDPPLETQAQLLRVKLWNDLVEGNAEQATSDFSRLLNTNLDPTLSKPNKIANAAILGSVAGMLDSDKAESLIAEDSLQQVSTVIERCDVKEFGYTFNVKRDQAKEIADAVSDWLATNDSLSANLMVAQARKEEAEIEETSAELKSMKRNEPQERKDLKIAQDQLLEQKNKLTAQVEVLKLDWSRTPGLENLTEPDIRLIQVPLREYIQVGTEQVKVTKTRTVLRKDGTSKQEDYHVYQTKPKYEWVSRKSEDVRAEINGIYTNQMAVYEGLKGKRDQLLAAKEKLDGEIKATDESIAQKELQSKQAKIESVEHSKQAVELRLKASAVSLVRKAVEAGRAELAFRPPTFEIIDYGLEKRLLLDD